MKITGRHLAITPALRHHIESRFERLVRYEVKLSHLAVILGVSKLQHRAEVVCTIQGKRIQAKALTQEMYATIDQLVDRLETQIRKHKERRTNHKEPAKRLVRKVLRPTIRKEEEIEVIRPARAVLTLEEAKRRLDPLPGSLVVFTARSSGKVQILQRLDRDRVVLIDP
ncbi:MAG TPA: ribosome-associated translation inhibitor RaiA [Nitrospiraceae bacterium]|jgi:ribosomal subunit interface protein|nr:ribosome-associated translation inhibitor RaiA [Nitrospiraceae bacterium]